MNYLDSTKKNLHLYFGKQHIVINCLQLFSLGYKDCLEKELKFMSLTYTLRKRSHYIHGVDDNGMIYFIESYILMGCSINQNMEQICRLLCELKC